MACWWLVAVALTAAASVALSTVSIKSTVKNNTPSPHAFAWTLFAHATILIGIMSAWRMYDDYHCVPAHKRKRWENVLTFTIIYTQSDTPSEAPLPACSMNALFGSIWTLIAILFVPIIVVIINLFGFGLDTPWCQYVILGLVVALDVWVGVRAWRECDKAQAA